MLRHKTEQKLTSNGYLNLPIELLVKILAQLSLKDLAAVLRLNKFLSQLAKSDDVWKGIYTRFICEHFTEVVWSSTPENNMSSPHFSYDTNNFFNRIFYTTQRMDTLLPMSYKEVPPKLEHFPELKSHGWYDNYSRSFCLLKYVKKYLYNFSVSGIFDRSLHDIIYLISREGGDPGNFRDYIFTKLKLLIMSLDINPKLQCFNPTRFFITWMHIIFKLRVLAWNLQAECSYESVLPFIKVYTNVLHALANEIIKEMSKHEQWGVEIAKLKTLARDKNLSAQVVADFNLKVQGDSWHLYRNFFEKSYEFARDNPAIILTMLGAEAGPYFSSMDCKTLHKRLFTQDPRFIPYKYPGYKPGFFEKIRDGVVRGSEAIRCSLTS